MAVGTGGQLHVTHSQAQTNPGRHALAAPIGGTAIKMEDEYSKQGVVGGALAKQEPAFIADLLDLPARHKSPAPEPLEVCAMTSSLTLHLCRHMTAGPCCVSQPWEHPCRLCWLRPYACLPPCAAGMLPTW